MADQQEEDHRAEHDFLILLLAILGGDDREALEIIESKPDVNFFYEGETLLQHAISNHRYNIACALIDGGADVNATDKDGKTALMYCAQHGPDMEKTGDYQKLESELITKTANVNTDDKDGKTALMYAVLHRKPNLVDKLVKAGADVNIADTQGMTALMYAAQSGQSSLVDEFVKAGADVNKTDNQGRTALMFVCNEDIMETYADSLYRRRFGEKHEDKGILGLLVNAGADVNTADSQGMTALMFAVQSGRSSLVDELVKAGADVNKTDKQGCSALMYAVRYNTRYPYCFLSIKNDIDRFEKVIKILIGNGADSSVTDNNGKTALDYSLEYDNEHLACVLIEAGAKVNIIGIHVKTALLIYSSRIGNQTVIQEIIKSEIIKDDRGGTALMHALQNSHENVAHALLDAGADHSVIDNDGQSALIFAAIIGNESVVQRLIKAGAELNITDKEGRTALMYAIQHENENVACALLDAGADHSVIDKDGQSALFFAVIKENETVVQRLIKAGADLNITDNEGKTALFYVQYYGSPNVFMVDLEENDKNKIAKIMIGAGADVNITDDKGKTALMYAVENMCEDLASLLIDAGANVNVTDNQGNSALGYSFDTNTDFFSDWDSKIHIFTSVACKLIKAGANMDITVDNEGRTLLMHAILSREREFTNTLIEAGADVNIYDHEGKTALFYSLGHEDIIGALIEKGHANVNKRDRYGRTVLFYSFAESLDSTKYLLEKGGKLNVKDNCNMSIISSYIENSIVSRKGFSAQFKELNALLGKQITSNYKMFEAIINSIFCKIFHCKALNLQMARGKKRKAEEAFDLENRTNVVHSLDVRNIIEALQSAREYIGEQDSTKGEQLDKVIDIIKQEDRHLYENLQEITGLLVELGANPNYADSDGNTALHYATCLPLLEEGETTVAMTMCQKLEGLGASFHARNHQHETPLLYCLSKKEWVHTSQISCCKVKTLVEVCKYLLECGSSIEETTRSGKTVFHFILELFQEGLSLIDKRERKEVLVETQKLLKLFPCSSQATEMTVNKRDGNLNSPLHLWAMLTLPWSLENDDCDNAFERDLLGAIFNHLVACGAKLNDKNKKDETPMHLCQSWTAVKLLIDSGATPKDLDSEGRTPLLVASENISSPYTLYGSDYLYPDVSKEPNAFWKTVLEHDLDPWAVDNHGSSVLSVLIKKEAIELSQALVEVACEEGCIQDDTIAVSLLNAVCQDSSTHKQWKSILVQMILESRKSKSISFPSNKDTALHLSCRNMTVKLQEEFSDKGILPIIFNEDEDGSDEDSDSYFFDDVHFSILTNVHWMITKQLLRFGLDCNALNASGQSCLDIAKTFPPLQKLLLEPLDLDEVPLAFPWTSISTKYKPILSKVARRQECKQLDSYWYHEKHIQKGSFGLVFAGMNEKDGREVAIKRIEKLRNQQQEAEKKEIKHLTSLADCEQVVRYLSFTEDEHFSYVILELMEGNLNDYLDGAAFDEAKSVQLCGDVLKGLKYLHEYQIIHRDMKPSNILFKTYPELCLKIADFGLSRRINTLGTYTTSTGSVVGTRCWIAPEVLKCSSSKTKHQMTCDVFSAGLVLYYILSRKKHPFSPADCKDKSDLQISNETESNVINGRMESFKDIRCPEATNLVHSTLDSEPTKRPTAALALAHPLFWSKKKKMDFLSAVGNQPEFECPRAYLHKRALPVTSVEFQLDSVLKNKIITHPTWDDARYVHMPAIYTEMTKKRKPYNTTSVVELVRFIRNALAHVSEDKRPTPVRQYILEDFVFLEYFPDLVMEVFTVIKKYGWDVRQEIKYQLNSSS